MDPMFSYRVARAASKLAALGSPETIVSPSGRVARVVWSIGGEEYTLLIGTDDSDREIAKSSRILVARVLSEQPQVAALADWGALQVAVSGSDIVITGDTYTYKSLLREAGCRWDSAAKAWRIATESFGQVVRALPAPDMSTPAPAPAEPAEEAAPAPVATTTAATSTTSSVGFDHVADDRARAHVMRQRAAWGTAAQREYDHLED